jgi:hypothetical protein
MAEHRPDPGGTPDPEQHSLTRRPMQPEGDDRPERPHAIPGAYEADEDEQERGKAVKPGN